MRPLHPRRSYIRSNIFRSNRQNDALLHKLIHTQLLSGVANPDELNLTGAQRRKALEGRVLELAEKTKIGKGESLVRKAERNKAAKRVRLGIESKQKARMKQKLEEVCRSPDCKPIVTLSHFPRQRILGTTIPL